MSFVEEFDRIFAGRRDVWSEGYPSEKDPNKFSYRKVEEPLTLGQLKEHLLGTVQIGVYPIRLDNTVSWFAVDFDGSKDMSDGDAFALSFQHAKEQRDRFKALGLTSYLERSRSGRGVHVWGFLEQPIAAAQVRRALWPHVLDHVTKDRWYPMQDVVGPGLYGNLLALPFQGKAYKQGNAVFITDDGEAIEPRTWLAEIKYNSLELINDLAGRNQVMETARIWRGGSRGDMQYDSGEVGALKLLSPYGCSFMRHVYEDRKTLSEPEWHAGLQIASHFRNGRDLAHILSRGHPGYNERETNEKYEQVLANERVGCAWIHANYPQHACAGCPMKAPHWVAKKSILELVGGQSGTTERLGSFEDDLDRIMRLDSGEAVSGLKTGLAGLDEVTRYRRNELVVVGARPSMGKASACDAKVLTPTGWTTMGELKVGDQLASHDGRESTVLAVFPQGEEQVYRVTFSDGRSTEVSGEHLWRVYYRGWPMPRVITTHKLQTLLTRARYKNRLWIDVFRGEFGSDEVLPLDPWLLGVLLGDGGLTSGSPVLSTGDEEVLVGVAETLPSGIAPQFNSGYDYVLSRGYATSLANPVTAELRALGVWGCRPQEKFIPAVYLNANNAARLALLQGLLDTDGHITPNGSIEYSTSSKQLAEQVQELARSLGCVVTIASRFPTYTYKGARRVGLRNYRVRIRSTNPGELFRLVRKRERGGPSSRVPRLTVQSIVPSRVTETQCILVSHPDHLYVTDDFIVTHNTQFMIQSSVELARAGTRVFVFSAETGTPALRDRYLAHVAEVDSRLLRGEGYRQLTAAEWDRLKAAAKELPLLPLHVNYTALSPDEVLAQVEQVLLEARADLDQQYVVFFDYLQFGNREENEKRLEQVTRLSREFKFVSKILMNTVVVFSQLNRDAEGSDDADMTSFGESGQIERDADVAMLLLGDRVDGEKAARRIGIPKQRDGVANVKIPFVLNQTYGLWEYAGGNARSDARPLLDLVSEDD